MVLPFERVCDREGFNRYFTKRKFSIPNTSPDSFSVTLKMSSTPPASNKGKNRVQSKAKTKKSELANRKKEKTSSFFFPPDRLARAYVSLAKKFYLFYDQNNFTEKQCLLWYADTCMCN